MCQERRCGMGVFSLCVIISLFSNQMGLVRASDCALRNYRHGYVCVCNSTYCDTAPSVEYLEPNQIVLISSTKAGARFKVESIRFGSHSNTVVDYELHIDSSAQYQKLLGFGGAFTDAAGINIAKLSVLTQERLLRSYYSQDGIEYGMGRVPIGGTDFSTRAYSYADSPGDTNLSSFALPREDLFFKMPYIDWAKSLSSKPLRLFASPWSAPTWMKSNGQFSGEGHLLMEYYQVWANYFVRFLEEYRKRGIHFWGLTSQNEPVDGRIEGFPFNCMGWDAGNQSLFIGLNLGPTLEANGFGSIKIMALDDQRLMLPAWARTVLSHPEARKYVSGIGVHWYGNLLSPPQILTTTHEMFPNHFILSTEACEGDKPWQEDVALGDWARLESYAHDIIESLNNWVAGWVDWNLVLDEKGGPNWADNFVDAPIIVNETANEFYKQPTFYAMGHFSKYIPEDSVRIKVTAPHSSRLFAAAFLRPDQMRVVVILNRSDDQITLKIHDAESGLFEIRCSPRSLYTIMYS